MQPLNLSLRKEKQTNIRKASINAAPQFKFKKRKQTNKQKKRKQKVIDLSKYFSISFSES